MYAEIASAISAVSVGIATLIIRSWIASVKTDIASDINKLEINLRSHCTVVSNGIQKTLNGDRETNKDAHVAMWDRLNHHGHKGLGEDDSKVTVDG